jgi:soluble lytic murein transglycosylase-like protein
MQTGLRFPPTVLRRRVAAALLVMPLLAGCAMAGLPSGAAAPAPLSQHAPPPRLGATVEALIEKYAAHYGVPASLIRRVVARESGGNPAARNGPYWGLMQIRHDTARTMGYRGAAGGLLDADTNLRYAVKYLRGAWLVGGRDQDAAIRHYARGYYYEAKRLGMLEETGLR